MTKQILIDGTTISRHMDGLSQYILNVVSRLPVRDDWQYHVVVRPDECPNDYLDRWKQQGILIHTSAIAPIGPKREWQFRRWLSKQPPFDAAFVPSNQYPLALTMPTAYVVHDIIYERYPGQLGRYAALKRFWLHRNVAQGLKQAKCVIAVSRFTRSEILRFHPKADERKIQVVYEGWEHLRTLSAEQDVQTPFRDYIIYIGSSRGHKNMQGLLDALAIAKPRLPKHTGLVIAGENSMLSAAQHKQIEALSDCVLTTGWLNQTALTAYCRKAKAVIFPSLCEGFGIPVLEAFYFRKPLLLSNASSLPEVAGDAALYFNPEKPEEIAEAILQGLEMSESEQQTWITKGLQRLERFSWQKTADEIGKILQDLLR